MEQPALSTADAPVTVAVARSTDDNRSPPLLPFVCGATVAFLLLFRVFNWQRGITRAVLVMIVAALVLFLPSLLRRLGRTDFSSANWRNATRFAAFFLALDLCLGLFSIATTAYSGRIRMDQGQSTYRAALLMLRGENPYGRGALLDITAFHTRRTERSVAGIPHQMSHDQFHVALASYWESLDPVQQRQLLPLPTAEHSPQARLEASILGYKYGPIPILLTIPLVKLLGPASIPLLNLVAFSGWIAVLVAILRQTQLSPTSIAVVIGSILATYEIPLNFLHLTASDIWPLLFSSLAVWALLANRPICMGCALGLALASKIFPAALFLPLLLRGRSISAIALAMTATLLVTAGLYGPFIAWDPEAFFLNVVRWPSLMVPDSTAWVFYASHSTVTVARAAIATLLIILALRLVTGKEERLFRSLALMNLALVLAGVAFHNNYVTWFVPWVFFAIAEALANIKTLPSRWLSRNLDHQRWKPATSAT